MSTNGKQIILDIRQIQAPDKNELVANHCCSWVGLIFINCPVMYWNLQCTRDCAINKSKTEVLPPKGQNPWWGIDKQYQKVFVPTRLLLHSFSNFFKSYNTSHLLSHKSWLSSRTVTLFCYRADNARCYLHVFLSTNSYLCLPLLTMMSSPKFRIFLKFNYLVLFPQQPVSSQHAKFHFVHISLTCVPLILITAAGVSAYLPLVLKKK